MSLAFCSRKTRLICLTLLMAGGAGKMFAAQPVITSASSVDVTYDAQNPADGLFAYRIVATNSPTTFEATGLPPTAFLSPTTGWINGSRALPGLYDVAVRATNAEGTGTATVRIAIHPAAIGVESTQGIFRPGASFSIRVRYNTVMQVSGAPHLSLVVGPAGAANFRDAVYSSGSGTTELVFQYLVTAGDADPDGVQLLPTAPQGGAIYDANGLTASPSLPVKYFVSGITVETEAKTAALSVASSSGAAGRLVNVSSRMRVVAGDSGRSLIAGFVVSGLASRRVLLRAVGPALAGFGVPGALADPRLQLFSGAGALVAANDNWSGADTRAAMRATGAFALSDDTRDAAVVVTLAPGAYTLVVAPNGGDGEVLAEVYDADDAATTAAPAIVNLSTRGYVEAGGSLIAGFVLQGDGPRRVLVRGVGPALTAFGVAGALNDPTVAIFRNNQLVAQNDDWQTAGADLAATMTASGAFALPGGSKDAAVVMSLAPGAYTAVVSDAVGSSGAALVEVYELPIGGQ